MNEIEVFKNSEFGEVRTTQINNEVWFVGKDIAEALGYEVSRNAIAKHVSEEDKLTHQISASGQLRDMVFINESGVYALIFSSKLESAKKFKHWVTSEVLPAVRRHGMYAVDELLEDPDMAIKVFEELKKERAEKKRLAEQNKNLQIELDESKDWYSIKRMQKLNHGKEFSYSLLKKESKKLGYDVKEVFDQNYGQVNAYHKAVWESLYFDTLNYEEEDD